MKALEQASELRGRGRVIDKNTHELIPAVDYWMSVRIVKYEDGYSCNAYHGCFWTPYNLDEVSYRTLVLEMAREHGSRKFVLGPCCGRCLPGELNEQGFAWGEATPIR